MEKDRLFFSATGNTIANKAAFDMYSKPIKNNDCDYERKDNYVYTFSNKKKLKDEIYDLGKIGFNAMLCKNQPLPSNNVGAVRLLG